MMEPHMIDFVELASLGCKIYLFVFVIMVNHLVFICLAYYKVMHVLQVLKVFPEVFLPGFSFILMEILHFSA